MLTIHFLNVGHGDCTIIRHPSGRLTMVDINNSQDFDAQTFADELAEERLKHAANSLLGVGLGSLASLGTLGSLSEYAAVADRAKRELTDPIEFLKTHYSGQSIWRFVLTHPDLDHMRGLKLLSENIGISNFWDTDHTKTAPTFRSDADKLTGSSISHSAAVPLERMSVSTHGVTAIMLSEKSRTDDSVETISKSCRQLRSSWAHATPPKHPTI
jgi:hypothetical protein